MAKPLQWFTRRDGVTCAEPEGLEKWYYIYPPIGTNDEYCLSIIDSQGKYEDHELLGCLNDKMAKRLAFEHYSEIIARYA